MLHSKYSNGHRKKKRKKKKRSPDEFQRIASNRPMRGGARRPFWQTLMAVRAICLQNTPVCRKLCLIYDPSRVPEPHRKSVFFIFFPETEIRKPTELAPNHHHPVGPSFFTLTIVMHFGNPSLYSLIPLFTTLFSLHSTVNARAINTPRDAVRRADVSSCLTGLNMTLPGDSAFQSESQAFNARFSYTPAAIVLPYVFTIVIRTLRM